MKTQPSITLEANASAATYPNWEPIIFDDHGQPACSSPQEEAKVWAAAITDGVFDRIFNNPTSMQDILNEPPF